MYTILSIFLIYRCVASTLQFLKTRSKILEILSIKFRLFVRFCLFIKAFILFMKDESNIYTRDASK